MTECLFASLQWKCRLAEPCPSGVAGDARSPSRYPQSDVHCINVIQINNNIHYY